MSEVIILPKRDRTIIPAGSVVIDTTSHDRSGYPSLSPMILGPCTTPEGIQARTVEQLWQNSKLYQQHADARGKPTASFTTWRAQGFARSRAERYPMGKGARPLCSIWGNQRLDYVEARKRIYFPAYRNALRASAAWTGLLERVVMAQARNQRVVLLDFDGYDHRTSPWNGSLEAVMEDQSRPMGHAFVILAMLLNGPEVTPDQLS